MGMNSKPILLGAALLGAFFASASAATQADAFPSSVPEREEFFRPSPVKIVSPAAVPRRYRSETVRVGFTVDAAGRVRHAQLLSPRDPILEKHLLPALAAWKFSPAKRNGQAVTVDVVLPLQLVDEAAQ